MVESSFIATETPNMQKIKPRRVEIKIDQKLTNLEEIYQFTVEE
jgi:hypothetical protein